MESMMFDFFGKKKKIALGRHFAVADLFRLHVQSQKLFASVI